MSVSTTRIEVLNKDNYESDLGDYIELKNGEEITRKLLVWVNLNK